MVTFVSAILIAAAVTASQVIVFPGNVKSVAAPDGSGARVFYQQRVDADGSQASPVIYANGRGRQQRVATVQRSIGVSWSPAGKWLFLQDNWGSDIADCYVLTRTNTGVTSVSLLKLIQRTPGHPSGSERPNQSHYYVHCDRWNSPDEIAGGVSGHTDGVPLHAFSHDFAYDVPSHRIRWRRRSPHSKTN